MVNNKNGLKFLSMEVGRVSDRGTSNSPNTRNPERPPGKPSRLDQFADDLFDGDDKAKERLDVTSHQEKKKWL